MYIYIYLICMYIYVYTCCFLILEGPENSWGRLGAVWSRARDALQGFRALRCQGWGAEAFGIGSTGFICRPQIEGFPKTEAST